MGHFWVAIPTPGGSILGYQNQVSDTQAEKAEPENNKISDEPASKKIDEIDELI